MKNLLSTACFVSAALVAGLSFAQVGPMFPGPQASLSPPLCTANTQGGGTYSNIIFLHHFDNSGTDSGPGGRNLTLNGGATYSNAVTAKFGTDSYKGALSSSSASIGGTVPNIAGDFTIEFWLYVTATPSGSWYLGDGTSGTTRSSFGFMYAYQVGAAHEAENASAYLATGSWTWATNAWHSYAWSRSGSTWNFFYDGVSQSLVGTQWTNNVGNGTNAWVIGNYFASGAQGWLYYIDEMRASNMARYTSNYTPSTLAFCNS